VQLRTSYLIVSSSSLAWAFLRIRESSLHNLLLDGSVKTWWRHTCTIHRAAGTLDTLYAWATFYALLLERFRPVSASHHARDRLASLKQDGPMMTYAQKMQELALQVSDMTDPKLLDRFMRGLRSRTRMEVAMREPQSFDDAVKLADRYDSLFSPGFGFSRQPSGFGTRVSALPVSFAPQSANPILPTPTPMEIDALRRRPAPLTPEERTRLMKTGGCF
jgi:hypothetical protein